MNKFSKLFFIFSIFFTLIAFGSNALSSNWVTNFSDNKKNIQILRNGTQIPFKIYTQLEKNDKILISNNKSFLEIESDSGDIFIINIDRSPFIVKGKNNSSALTQNIQVWLSAWFGVSEAKNRVVGLNSRGNSSNNKIYFPLIPTTKAKILKTNKKFLLTWSEGITPFTISAINIQNGEEEVLISDINKKEYNIPLDNLMGTNYIITVSNRNTSSDFLLQMVSKDEMPTFPNELFNESFSKSMQQLIYLIWLSDTENYIWRLQAFNDATFLAKKYYPASLFLNKLNDFQTHKLSHE